MQTDIDEYMHDLSPHALLSREEEHELTLRFAATRDPKIRARLVTANLRLVVKIAHEYRRACGDLLDLVQEGNLGLLQAVEKYNPHRSVKLSSYAAWWIRAFMLKFIMTNWRLVKIGTTQRQRKLFFNLRKERAKLEAEGILPTADALAERMSTTADEVAQMGVRLSASEVTLDAPRSLDGETETLLDTLEAGPSGQPDVQVEQREFHAALCDKLAAFRSGLDGREQVLLGERLMAEQPRTLKEIGQRFGVSRERARQLEDGLVGRLRQYLQQELPELAPAA